jgi:hypothetical protein
MERKCTTPKETEIIKPLKTENSYGYVEIST